MKRIGFPAMAALAVLIAFAGGDALARTVTVKDLAGRSVTAPFDPERIVCIGPGALRLIVYLEAQDKLCAVEDIEKRNYGTRPYLAAHPEFLALPRSGPGGPGGINKKPDLEAILAARAQVVFITYMESAVADEVQKLLGLPVVVLSYGTLATFDTTIYQSLEVAGRVLNRKQRADEVVEFIESVRKDLADRTAGIPESQKPLAYAGAIAHAGAHGIESTEKRYIPFDWTGTRGAVENVPASIGSHVFMDKELLLGLDPEIIFIDASGLVLVRDDYKRKPEFYGALKAFQTGKVFRLWPFNSYTTNIGTALADAYAIGKILNPDRFGDVDPATKADEFYSFLVGSPVCGEMEKDYGPLGEKITFSR